MKETLNFYNKGFGWVCRQCERELDLPVESGHSHSRFMTEGEAESDRPRMAVAALAKWADAVQRTLACPRCGITELVDIS